MSVRSNCPEPLRELLRKAHAAIVDALLGRRSFAITETRAFFWAFSSPLVSLPVI